MPTEIGAVDRQSYLSRALQAADWFVNSQVRPPKPWMADQGRWLYYYYMPEDKYVPGLNWTQGRGLFVLSEAHKIAPNVRYLESMELGCRYVRALQPMDPEQPITHGSFHEEIPQANFGGILDGAQAASGLLMHYRVTGNIDSLRRGRAFCQFLLRTYRPDRGLAWKVQYWPEKVRYQENVSSCIQYASAIPLWHLYNITGEGQFLGPLLFAADGILKCQRPDGAFNYLSDISGIKEPPFNHHWGLGTGQEKFILRNDDGIAVVVLAAYKITRDKKYLDAMVHYADWIISQTPPERPYNAFGIQAATILDIGKLAGKDYSPWVLDHLEKRCLNLQVQNSTNPKADGGFRGEDEEGNSGIFGGTALDYVVTRTTCYMAGLLFRLSGQGTGAGFSVFGLGD